MASKDNKGGFHGPLEQVGPCQWRIPKSYREDMRVDGLIFADEHLIDQIKKDQGPEQVANVATLPGIQKASLAMPDIHWGYGFAIGGVAATDPEEGGVISPGGVGYDINCGVRLLRSNLDLGRRSRPRIRQLVDQLFRDIPTGVGQSGPLQVRQAQAEAKPDGSKDRPTSSSEGGGLAARPRVHRGSRPARRALIPTASATAPSPEATTSAAPSARETTSSKSRSSTASSTPRGRQCHGSARGS